MRKTRPLIERCTELGCLYIDNERLVNKMTDWFLGDPHFYHKNIIRYERLQFSSVEEMNQTIIDNYNSVVRPGDHVYFMGDLFFCNSKKTAEICQQLHLDQTRNFLIRGNHDKGITNNKFRSLGFMPTKIMLYSESIFLTHEPMSKENVNLLTTSGYPCYNLHAHTHGQDTGLRPDYWQCVSLEKTDFKPLSKEEVFERFTAASRRQSRI